MSTCQAQNKLVRDFPADQLAPAEPLTTEHKGCHSYSVPRHISEHVEIIKPTVHLNSREPNNPMRSHRRSNSNHLGQPPWKNGPKTNGVKVYTKPSLANCDEFITLDCLRALYHFNYAPKATARNSYGIGDVPK